MTPDVLSKNLGDVRQTTRNAEDLDTATQTIRSFVQLATIGVLIAALLQDVKLPVTLLGLCVILLMWLIVRTNAIPLLVTLQMVMLFHEPSRTVAQSEFGKIVYVAVALGLLTFLSRDRSLQRLISRNLRDFIRSFSGKPKDSTNRSRPASDRSQVLLGNRRSISLFRQIAVLLICVLLSQLLLTSLATSGGVVQGSRSLPDSEKLLGQVSPLLIITLVAVIVTSELTWRRLTIGQASMYLRSTQVTLLHADLRMIVKGRLRFLRRQKKTRPTPPSESVEPTPSVHDLRK